MNAKSGSGVNGAGGEVKLDDLYQEVILDHNKRPRNFRKPEGATSCAHGVYPLCGDDYHLYLKMSGDGVITGVGFEGQGCAISKSSASLLTTAVEGRTAKEAETLKNHFIHLLTDSAVSEATRAAVGRLKLFEGVKNFPIRVKCATLIWRTLEEALKDERERQTEVSTEKEEKR